MEAIKRENSNILLLSLSSGSNFFLMLTVIGKKVLWNSRKTKTCLFSSSRFFYSFTSQSVINNGICCFYICQFCDLTLSRETNFCYHVYESVHNRFSLCEHPNWAIKLKVLSVSWKMCAQFICFSTQFLAWEVFGVLAIPVRTPRDVFNRFIALHNNSWALEQSSRDEWKANCKLTSNPEAGA